MGVVTTLREARSRMPNPARSGRERGRSAGRRYGRVPRWQSCRGNDVRTRREAVPRRGGLHHWVSTCWVGSKVVLRSLDGWSWPGSLDWTRPIREGACDVSPSSPRRRGGGRCRGGGRRSGRRCGVRPRFAVGQAVVGDQQVRGRGVQVCGRRVRASGRPQRDWTGDGGRARQPAGGRPQRGPARVGAGRR